jgi:hypothetical protein
MIHSAHGVRVIVLALLAATATGISGCTTHQKEAAATAGGKSHKVARPAAVKTAKITPVRSKADPVRTASLAAAPEASGREADLVGKSWIYRYGKSRGTIIYHADGTSTYDEPGIRSGTGRWQIHGDKFCQSFSGIPEPCQTLRRSGQTYYAGSMTLVTAKP